MDTPAGAVAPEDDLLLLTGSFVSAGSARAILGRPGDQTSALCFWVAAHPPDTSCGLSEYTRHNMSLTWADQSGENWVPAFRNARHINHIKGEK